jgi:uncharacterized protein (TIGR03435 family)
MGETSTIDNSGEPEKEGSVMTVPAPLRIVALSVAACLLAGASGRTQAQVTPGPAPAGAAQAFEVATIKLDKSTGLPNWRLLPGGRFVSTRVPLRNLIRLAYGQDAIVRPMEQILQAPGWIDSDRFTIDAKAASEFVFDTPGVSSQAFAMLRTLLEEKFKLVARVEKRELPVYHLTVLRKDGILGPDMKPSSVDCRAVEGAAPDPACQIRGGARAGIAVQGRPLGLLVTFLNINQTAVDRLVVDRTGLTGMYDMRLQFIPPYQFGPGGTRIPSPDVDTGPTLETALREQLGLKLEPVRAPTTVVVIEHIERLVEP